jgi:hypothetical protein
MCPEQSPEPKKQQDTTPINLGQTAKRVFFLTEELSKKIDEKAVLMFGERKGNVSLYVEQAMRIHLHMTIEGVTER